MVKIEQWPTDRPKPYPKNPRKIPAAAVTKVAASIREFGFQQPIVVDRKGVVIVGHARLAAAKELELERVPILVARGLSPRQVQAYRLADNRLNQDSAWDEELLGLELADLVGLDFDLDLTGFDPAELTALVSPTDGRIDEDDAPAPPDKPISRLGDVWRCGPHRLLCGDATKAEDVAKALDGAKPNLMVTDPPYGVEYDPDWRNYAERSPGVVLGAQATGKVKGDGKRPVGVAPARAIGEVQHDDRIDWGEAFALFPGNVVYIWCASWYVAEVAAVLDARRWIRRALIIWAKQHFAISRGHYHWQHENCWYAVRKGRSANWHGGRKQTTLWAIANRSAFGGETDDASTIHGTQKPVECMRRPIQNHTRKGDAVYDPFIGSGTTMIAAETIGRVCYGIDIDPIYVDVAVKRWQNFTGKRAILEGDGRAFVTIEHNGRAKRKSHGKKAKGA